jgi:hypothetical protein
MKNNSIKTRILVFAAIMIGFVVLWQSLQTRCSKRSVTLDTPIYIKYLYPGPGEKISFSCHVFAFLKSPFAPARMSDYVFKENGVRILGGQHREGVVVADILVTQELWHLFPEPLQIDTKPVFADSVFLYVDGKELPIGHLGYRDFDLEFNVATILSPFLLPGDHVGKIIILQPTGEALEYEWEFEITWW